MMGKPDDRSEGSTPNPPIIRENSQSSTNNPRQLVGNSSARRFPYPGNLGDRNGSRSSPASTEDIRLQNISRKSTYRNESNSQLLNSRAIDADSQTDVENVGIEDATQINDGSVKPNGYQDPAQAQSRDVYDYARNSDDSVRTEHTFIQRRDLGMLDVAALIINKQIGTGIFTTPGLVLSLTGSKTISIAMWFCGGIWAFLSVIIYVEFGSAFPFNGGELIYLDEVFRRPELLATILFSAFFITVPNTDGNSLQFAKHVLLAANPDVLKTTDLDKRLISYVAVSILTFVCFLHYFSRNSGLLLNLLFAAYKIILVIVFIICGCIASNQPVNGKSDWGEQPITTKNVLAAMIYIIYSYQGWENANYVGGELKVKSQALKWGAFLAVGIVTLLYTLVTMAYSLACTFNELAGQDLGIVSFFAPKAFGNTGGQGIKICIALSAFGNLIAVVYTSAKVKQQIARQCIIPFFKFFSRDDKQFVTPKGALILHWVFAVAWILATPNTSDGYGFVIGLFIYGQLVVGVFVGFAFFDIRRTYEADETRAATLTGGPVVWEPVILKSRWLRIPCALIFIGMNLMVLVESARSYGYPPSFLRPVVIFGLLFVASLYWLTLRILDSKSNANSPLEVRIVRDGMVNQDKDMPVLSKAKLEGNARVVVYETHGGLRRILTAFEVVLHKAAKLVVR